MATISRSSEKREFNWEEQGSSSGTQESDQCVPAAFTESESSVKAPSELELFAKVYEFDSLLRRYMSEATHISSWTKTLLSAHSNSHLDTPSGVKVMVDYEVYERLKKDAEHYQKQYEETAAKLERVLLENRSLLIDLKEAKAKQSGDQGHIISEENTCVPLRFRSEEEEIIHSQVTRVRSEDEADLSPSPGGSSNQQRLSLEREREKKRFEAMCAAMH